MGSLQSWVALWWAPTGDIRLTSQVRGRWHPPIPVPAFPSSTHAQAGQDHQSTWQAGCLRHPTASKIPSDGGLPQSQRALPPHRCPAATFALPHVCPNMDPIANPPHQRPLSCSPCARRQQKGRRLEGGTVVYTLVQGKSGIIYGNSDVAK